jgi:hypothetical protein
MSVIFFLPVFLPNALLLSFLDLIIVVTFAEEYKLWSFLLLFHPPSPCSSPSVRYVLIFTFLGSKQEDKGF